MAKISKPKCKFCGALMEKKQLECPGCGRSKNLVLSQCDQCGAPYGMDPRDKATGLCPNCAEKKAGKRILIKAGVIMGIVVVLAAYKVFKTLIHG